MTKKYFSKPAKTVDDMLKLLTDRGLIIEDLEIAKHHLSHVGYFRLSGYFKFFQDKATNRFHENTTFRQVMNLYGFDRKLRLLTLDAIEKIEVSLKAKINDYMGLDNGCFWYLKDDLFSLDKEENQEIYSNVMNAIKSLQKRKSCNIFVKEYFNKYDEKYLPCWMLFEELNFGDLSNIFYLIKSDYSKEISTNYNVYYLDLKKWISVIVTLRNICAHHSRLWNKKYIKRPRSNDLVFTEVFTKENTNNGTEVIPNFFNSSLILNHLLKEIHSNFNWSDKLSILFNENPEIDIRRMGFEENWKELLQ